VRARAHRSRARQCARTRPIAATRRASAATRTLSLSTADLDYDIDDVFSRHE